MCEEVPRTEYPRPDRVRPEWANLNGAWRFAFDDDDLGLRLGWCENASAMRREIQVPFPYQAPLSGVGTADLHPVVWYARFFTVPSEWANRRVLLHFGAVDYRTLVWVNGALAAANAGGHVPFCADVTPFLQSGENLLVVRVEDRQDPGQPRGKQSLWLESRGARYTRTTGIWQTVWMEPVPQLHVTGLRLLPNPQEEHLRVGVDLSSLRAGTRVRAQVFLTGSWVAAAEAETTLPPRQAEWTGPHRGAVWVEVPVSRPLLWTPEDPDLYDLVVEVVEGDRVVDRVESYFGMREVRVQ
ncbi:MAG: glycoside hydrolase family 2, partial [Armatimonadota bacterium]|nr:glycoside hydrolase family 2 [Armatimonadota bacterium]